MSEQNPPTEHVSLTDLLDSIERSAGRPTQRGGLEVLEVPEVSEVPEGAACRVDAAIARSAVLAIPTESSYGLAVDPADPVAVDRIFELKGRADTAPLLVVAANVGQLTTLGLDLEHPLARRASAQWPAPLTVVLPSPRQLPAQRGFPTLAVRVPELPALRRLLEWTGPLTATSANRSGEPAIFDPTSLDELLAGVDALVIDGGALQPSEPSTLLAWNEQSGCEVVLRQGAWSP